MALYLYLMSQPSSLQALEHYEQNGHVYRKIQVLWDHFVLPDVRYVEKHKIHWYRQRGKTCSVAQRQGVLSQRTRIQRNTAVGTTNLTLSLQCHKMDTQLL